VTGTTGIGRRAGIEAEEVRGRTNIMKTRYLAILPALALAAAPVSEVGIGDRLPELRGEFLTGREAVLPQAAADRVALLLMGFTYKSRHAVEAWAGKFRAQFESDPRVTFYEIPMIGGPARLGKWFIDSGMRRGTPKSDHEHVITVYKNTSSWKQLVRFSDPDAAYLVLLDQTGKVAWLHRGTFDEATFQALSSKVSDLESVK
jgi:hypothetical protein